VGCRFDFAAHAGCEVKAPSSFNGVFIHRGPVDMRRGINGLCEIVQSANMGEITGKNLFVFCGKRRDSIKVLYFDRSGFCLWQKRLETDKFPWPKKHAEEIVILSPQQFSWLLEGFDVWKIKPFADAHFERVS
jgi:transposase